MCNAFYCFFVPSFVSVLHSNLFSPQTNRWRAAICKTEQGGSTELERRLDEERESGEGRVRKRKKEELREAGKHGGEETQGKTEQGKERGKQNAMVEVNSCSAPQREHIRMFPQHGSCVSLYSCGLQVSIRNFSTQTRWRVAVAIQRRPCLCV